MIQLNPHKDTYAIPVPLDAVNLRIWDDAMGNWLIGYNTLEKLPPGKWQILGEVTKGFISPEILKSLGLTAEEVYSLLAANGVYFVNPFEQPITLYGEPEKEGVVGALNNQWQSFEDKLVEKVLIIKNTEK